MQGQAVLFSKQSDEWATPQDLFDELDQEFRFTLDAAARAENTKCLEYFGPDHLLPDRHDALVVPWGLRDRRETVWCNPPYSKCKEFVAKAWRESVAARATVVMLLPARTDTRWFHAFIWDRERHQPDIDVQVRFLKGRLKFGGSTNSAPFPSMVVVFR